MTIGSQMPELDRGGVFCLPYKIGCQNTPYKLGLKMVGQEWYETYVAFTMIICWVKTKTMVNGQWMITCGLMSGAVHLIRLTFNIIFAPSFLTFPLSLCTFQILGGVAGSEDFPCATLPTTPLDFQAKI